MKPERGSALPRGIPSPRGIPFVKMQGVGNDYVFLDVPGEPPEDPAALARAVSNRHFGIGADGLVLILPEPDAHARMRIFNIDGSEAGMCGNALRCVARYLWERGRAPEEGIAIAMGARRVTARILRSAEEPPAVEIDMGLPVFAAPEVPVLPPGDAPEMVDMPLPCSLGEVSGTAVSMGNPHLVIFRPDPLADEAFQRLGPELERHPAFPEGTNVEFVEVRAPDLLVVRVWERGSGPTLGCGSGACAVLAAARRTGRAGDAARILLPGGGLRVRVDPEGRMLLAGPAEIVFEGRYYGPVNDRT